MDYKKSKKLRKQIKRDIRPEIIEELKMDGFIEKGEVINYLDKLIESKTTPTKFQKIMNWLKIGFFSYLVLKVIYLFSLGEPINQELLLETIKIVLSP